ncbi:TPA_asm: hypothetical protein vir335_00056 [Classicovirus victor]|uniref:Uncharacterized protein n=1 Tax=Caudoviricetes sp. vir335 TaxID=3068357 RepID=A0AA86XS66_9CAUD|nr:TPA_asm: hypothetical protein vir335_00056 [Caudoviricetes sp. vir335]
MTDDGSPYDDFLREGSMEKALGLFERKNKNGEQPGAGTGAGTGADAAPESGAGFGGKVKNTLGKIGEKVGGAPGQENAAETHEESKDLASDGMTFDSDRPVDEHPEASDETRMRELRRMGEANKEAVKNTGAGDVYADRTDPENADEVAAKQLKQNEQVAADAEKQRRLSNEKTWAEEQDEAEKQNAENPDGTPETKDAGNPNVQPDSLIADPKQRQEQPPQDSMYQDPKAQDIYRRHAEKFLKAAGETAVENWGEGVSRGWDMAQNIVKMTLTHPSAMSSSSRLIGTALTGLQTASDFADKAAARYGMAADADPELVKDTLRYRLYRRDAKAGENVVGNTFRTISDSLARNGGDMADMSPSQLSAHMRDMQGEKDRLVAALQEPDLKPSDRRLLMGQAQHLQSYMTGIARQAKSLQAQQNEANRYARVQDLDRRKVAYDTLPSGDPNPWSLVLHEASPKFNLEIDPQTGAPKTREGMNAAAKTIEGMIGRIEADAAMDPNTKAAYIAHLHGLLKQAYSTKERWDETSARTKASDFGSVMQDLAARFPALANDNGKRLRDLYEKGEWPSDGSVTLRALTARFAEMAASGDEETRNVGNLFLSSLNSYVNSSKLGNRIASYSLNDRNRAINGHVAELKAAQAHLDELAEQAADGTLTQEQAAEKAKYEARIAMERSLIEGLQKGVSDMNIDEGVLSDAYKDLHKVLFRSTRDDVTGARFDVNDPKVQEALARFDSVVRRYEYKYFNRLLDRGAAVRGVLDGQDGGGAPLPPPGGQDGRRVNPGRQRQRRETPPADIPPRGEDETPIDDAEREAEQPEGEGAGLGGGDRQDDTNVPPEGETVPPEKEKAKKLTRAEQQYQTRMKNVQSAILGEDDFQNEEDRAAIETMFRNGWFKFNGDNSLKTPDILSKATLNTLIKKIDDYLKNDSSTGRMRELSEEYLAGLEKQYKSKFGEKSKGDGKREDAGNSIEPNEFFHRSDGRTAENIVDELKDLGVLVDDGKGGLEITMQNDVLRSVRKRMGNIKDSVLKKAIGNVLKEYRKTKRTDDIVPPETDADVPPETPAFDPSPLNDLNGWNLDNADSIAEGLKNMGLGNTDVIRAAVADAADAADAETAKGLAKAALQNHLRSLNIDPDRLEDAQKANLDRLGESLGEHVWNETQTRREQNRKDEEEADSDFDEDAFNKRINELNYGDWNAVKKLYDEARQIKGLDDVSNRLQNTIINKYDSKFQPGSFYATLNMETNTGRNKRDRKDKGKDGDKNKEWPISAEEQTTGRAIADLMDAWDKGRADRDSGKTEFYSSLAELSNSIAAQLQTLPKGKKNRFGKLIDPKAHGETIAVLNRVKDLFGKEQLGGIYNSVLYQLNTDSAIAKQYGEGTDERKTADRLAQEDEAKKDALLGAYSTVENALKDTAYSGLLEPWAVPKKKDENEAETRRENAEREANRENAHKNVKPVDPEEEVKTLDKLKGLDSKWNGAARLVSWLDAADKNDTDARNYAKSLRSMFYVTTKGGGYRLNRTLNRLNAFRGEKGDINKGKVDDLMAKYGLEPVFGTKPAKEESEPEPAPETGKDLWNQDRMIGVMGEVAGANDPGKRWDALEKILVHLDPEDDDADLSWLKDVDRNLLNDRIMPILRGYFYTTDDDGQLVPNDELRDKVDEDKRYMVDRVMEAYGQKPVFESEYQDDAGENLEAPKSWLEAPMDPDPIERPEIEENIIRRWNHLRDLPPREAWDRAGNTLLDYLDKVDASADDAQMKKHVEDVRNLFFADSERGKLRADFSDLPDYTRQMVDRVMLKFGLDPVFDDSLRSDAEGGAGSSDPAVKKLIIDTQRGLHRYTGYLDGMKNWDVSKDLFEYLASDAAPADDRKLRQVAAELRASLYDNKKDDHELTLKLGLQNKTIGLSAEQKSLIDRVMDKYGLASVFGTEYREDEPSQETGAGIPEGQSRFFDPKNYSLADPSGGKIGFAATEYGEKVLDKMSDYVATHPNADRTTLSIYQNGLKMFNDSKLEGVDRTTRIGDYDEHSRYEGESYGDEITPHMNSRSGDVFIPKDLDLPGSMSTVFHELGHRMDWIGVNAPRNSEVAKARRVFIESIPKIEDTPVSEALKNFVRTAKDMRAKIISDATAVYKEDSTEITSQVKDLLYFLGYRSEEDQKLVRQAVGKDVQKLIYRLRNNRSIRNRAAKFYIALEYKRAADSDFDDELNRRLDALYELDVQRTEKMNEVYKRSGYKEFIAKYEDWGEYADIYDAISGGRLLDERKIPSGHGWGYYSGNSEEVNASRKAAEIIAQYFSLSVTSPDIFRQLHRDLPEMARALDDYADKLNRYVSMSDEDRRITSRLNPADWM